MVSARHARRHAGIRVSLGTARTYTSSPWPAPVQINKKSRRREEREGRIPRPALARARAAERYGKRTACLHGEQSNLHQEELGAVVGGSSAGSAQKSSAAAVQPKNRGAKRPAARAMPQTLRHAQRPGWVRNKSPKYKRRRLPSSVRVSDRFPRCCDIFGGKNRTERQFGAQMPRLMGHNWGGQRCQTTKAMP